MVSTRKKRRNSGGRILFWGFLLSLLILFHFEPSLFVQKFIDEKPPSASRLNDRKTSKDASRSKDQVVIILESKDIPVSLEPTPSVPFILKKEKPLLSLVIDDCGGNLKLAKRVARLDLPLTWAILPNLTHTKATVNLAREQSIPFLLHLPMQAYVDGSARKEYLIGEGMSDEEIKKTIGEILPDFPSAFGVNNHRGSRATADPAVMSSVMVLLKKKGLFFLDSNTSPKSVAYKKAIDLGVPALKNGFFLDNDADLDKITERFAQASRLAKKRGVLVVICHLRPTTVEFLERYAQIPSASRNVELVTLPQMWQYVNALRQEKK